MKKRILSFLLALLMVVSIFPAPAYATDSTDATITPTETPTDAATEAACPTCGTVDCTSDHTNWCADCKKDNCGQTHVFCETCKKNDCGVDHTAELLRIPMTSTGQQTTETQSPDYSEDVGKYVKLNEAIVKFTVYGLTPSTGTLDEQIFMHEDFLTGSIFQIAEWMMKDGKVWYRLTFYKGGLDNNSTFAQNFPAEPWFMQTAANELVFIDTCSVCGKPDCSGHTWCDICEEYDCGKDHTQPPVEPENPCDCCESCIGAEGCACQCGNCDFCEKPEEPTVSSISATVNGQTVTVSGEALPEGATLEVTPVANEAAIMAELGMTGGFIWDIKVYDADGNEWQPEPGSEVALKLPVVSNDNEDKFELLHILENPNVISSVLNNKVDDAGVLELADYPYLMHAILSPGVDAYNQACGESNRFAAEKYELNVSDGYVTAYVSGFSIFTGTTYSSKTTVGTTEGSRIVLDDNITGDEGGSMTRYVTAGQFVSLDTGWVASNKWEWNSTYCTSVYKISSVDHSKYGFTVLSSAAEGTTFSVTFDRYVALKGKTYRYTVNFVVVKEYSVSYAGNGGTVSGDNPRYFITNEDVNTLATASRTGYTFGGWYYNGTKYSKWTENKSVTLTAKWDPITYTIKFNANDGTGSMASQTMTYDQAATLNENQFTSPQTGYVFSGWATSPTGGVVYSDKQSVSNLASTQDAVVNLYAVWTNTMEFTDVRIGLNESYWFTDYEYTVTADGVASSSYHAFPAEPAMQSILYTRATKDDNGNWVISDNAELPGTASLYIDPSIVYSNLFRNSVIATDSTRGVADPTGADTKAFLEFSNADYTAMIKVWLQSMADRTADTPNADGTYNINYKGTTHITDVNWNEEVNNWEEYEVIPYVIKMEKSGGSSTYNCWRIDMIIAPMRYLTLSYDLNINTAIGYSLTGGSSIPNTQYERDTTQNVLASPFTYNSKIEVSKTVNGVKYTAQFLYWEDEQGNKYGTGYNSTVLMDGHKNLKAIWGYPDQTMGSLRVEKDVTLPVNTGLTPDTSKAFTITVELGTSGSYPYTKYSSTGIVTETGSFTGTTKSFTLKADEYVIITGINQGTTYTVSEIAPTGYTNKSGTITGTIQAGNTMSATIVNENSSYTESFDFNGGSNTNTSVTVVYGSTNYFDVSWLEPTRTGHKFLGWFTAKEGGTQVYTDEGICIDGAYWSSKKWIGTADLPLYAQWEEEKYTVTFVDDDGTTILSKAEYEYNTPAASIVKPADPSKAATAEYTYEFTGWSPALSAVTADATYTATYTSVTNQYTLSGEIDHGTVTDSVTVNYGTQAKITYTPATGYKFQSYTVNDGSATSITTSEETWSYEDQQLTENKRVVVTTAPIEYTIAYELDGGSLHEGVTNPGSYTIATLTFTLNNPTRAGYKFKGWATSENATTGTESITIAKGTTGNKTYYAVWERSLVDLTIEAKTADTNQNLIFTVSGTRSDGVAFAPIDVVLCSENNFQVTIKDMPVGEYTVTEKDGWSWREDSVDSKTADLRTTSQTVSFDFGFVDDLHWLSGYSYKCKKGGS